MTVGLDWLPQTAFTYLLIFARVGSMLMLMPALGETTIPVRMRLSFALLFSLVLYPLLSSGLPAMPAEIYAMVVLLLHELAIGLILGALTRLITQATQVAGAIIAFQAGLSSAMAADPSQGGVQGAVVGSFLSFLGLALVFATDLHHVALAAIHDSYAVFPPTAPLMFDDAAQMAIRAVTGGFTVGVQMSAPFIVYGLIFNLGMGILSKLMPQLQVFFIAMPANVMIGMALLALLTIAMMGLYIGHFESELNLLRG